MEKAKQLAKEFERTEEDAERERFERMGNLKPDINNLLFMYLPSNISLEQMETLAMVINEMIWHPEKFLTSQSSDNGK